MVLSIQEGNKRLTQIAGKRGGGSQVELKKKERVAILNVWGGWEKKGKEVRRELQKSPSVNGNLRIFWVGWV